MYAQDNKGNLLGASWIATQKGAIKNFAYTDRAGTDDDLNWLYPELIEKSE